MSESTNDDILNPGEASDAKVCPEGQIWDEEAGKCITPEVAGSDEISPGGDNVAASLPLVKRIEKTVMQYMDAMEKRLNKTISIKIAEIVKRKDLEIERSLRKSFGLDDDPVVHLSDLTKMSRKLQLDSVDKSKRLKGTPEPGADGSKPVTQGNKIDALMKSYGMEK